MLIRRERPADAGGVSGVHRQAFAPPAGTPGVPPEVALVSALRRSPDWIPRLSLVADHPGDGVIGHVVCTRARIADRPAVALGPIGVLPHHQGAGVGHALMHAVLAAAEAIDETVIGVLGDPTFYGRFGFQPARVLGIEPGRASWGAHFQIRLLGEDADPPAGRFCYPAPFGEL